MYIANKSIRSNINGEVKEYSAGEEIPADAYDPATFAKWIKKGICRKKGDPAPDANEGAALAVHEDGDVTPNKSRGKKS